MTAHAPQETPWYPELVLDHWAKDDEAEALISGGRRLRRREARQQLLRLTGALRQQGLRPGDGVGVFTGNGVDAVLLHLAVHLAGCRLVFLPPEPGTGELAALIDRSEVRTLVVDAEFAGRAAEAVARCRSNPPVFGLGPGGPRDAPDLLELAAGLPAAAPAAPVSPAPGEAVTVLYTGGTLGAPKLPVHGRALYDMMALSAAAAAPGRVLAVTRLTHLSGHLAMLHAVLSGSALVTLPEWDAETALDLLREERIQVTALAPPMLCELLDDPRCRPGALPHLTQVSIGAAPVAPARLRRAVEVFGPVIAQGYGQSECPGITAMPPQDLPSSPGSPRWRSCGRPLPGTRVEIRGTDGAALPAGEIGEVCVGGPLTMLRYAADPERTAETLRDGLLHTGDTGYTDEEGFLYLVDRVRDVIVTGRGSGNVYSRLLEDFVAGLPGVREAAAVGVPDEVLGEAVRLYVVADGEVDTAALAEAVTAEIGELYTPRETVLLPSLPRTHIGKTDKRALRAR